MKIFVVLIVFIFFSAPVLAGDSDIAKPNTDGVSSEAAKPNYAKPNVASPNTGGIAGETAQPNYAQPNVGGDNVAQPNASGIAGEAAKPNVAKPNVDGIAGERAR